MVSTFENVIKKKWDKNPRGLKGFHPPHPVDVNAVISPNPKAKAIAAPNAPALPPALAQFHNSSPATQPPIPAAPRVLPGITPPGLSAAPLKTSSEHFSLPPAKARQMSNDPDALCELREWSAHEPTGREKNTQWCERMPEASLGKEAGRGKGSTFVNEHHLENDGGKAVKKPPMMINGQPCMSDSSIDFWPSNLPSSSPEASSVPAQCFSWKSISLEDIGENMNDVSGQDRQSHASRPASPSSMHTSNGATSGAGQSASSTSKNVHITNSAADWAAVPVAQNDKEFSAMMELAMKNSMEQNVRINKTSSHGKERTTKVGKYAKKKHQHAAENGYAKREKNFAPPTHHQKRVTRAHNTSTTG